MLLVVQNWTAPSSFMDRQGAPINWRVGLDATGVVTLNYWRFKEAHTEGPMTKSWGRDLSRRERQIMDVIFRDGETSVRGIASGIPDAPSHTAIRTLLRILERKGHVRRRPDGRRQLYRATVPRARAARAALENVLQTFFDGSLGDAVAAHLARPSTRIGRDELTRLRRAIKDARKEER